MEYTILEGGSHADLAEKVNGALRSGWKPKGGVAAYTLLRQEHRQEWMEIWFMQAIVKETE